ncbi:hypothetical protein TgHK011_008433 [Trichoderma gracile]|nr:hypothetical protein TgHK011_008433 [Trichoderma gracile]
MWDFDGFDSFLIKDLTTASIARACWPNPQTRNDLRILSSSNSKPAAQCHLLNNIARKNKEQQTVKETGMPSNTKHPQVELDSGNRSNWYRDSEARPSALDMPQTGTRHTGYETWHQ